MNEHRGRPGFPAICWRHHFSHQEKKRKEGEGITLTDGDDDRSTTTTAKGCSDTDSGIISTRAADAVDAVLWKTLTPGGEQLYVLQASTQGAGY